MTHFSWSLDGRLVGATLLAARVVGLRVRKYVGKVAPFLMNGRMAGAAAYNLTEGVEFRQVLRISRLGRQCADLHGIYAADKMIGVYSPLDVVFCVLGLEAYQCKGYKAEDAEAVGINLAVYFSTLK